VSTARAKKAPTREHPRNVRNEKRVRKAQKRLPWVERFWGKEKRAEPKIVVFQQRIEKLPVARKKSNRRALPEGGQSIKPARSKKP